ncbi:hypothetical protein FOZ63_023674 [Perkinsus olseni]|uniref:Uncharacterized protein n=1 Tax=Perkinsus olseni TaxID=32597 RepID=A0A7J6SBY4_PEROL|nr:hypothetical protein FOZ60_001195 [Perkinsus olseni]KAF4730211.1 hypothetical protein FOZ62_023741 [Perkinsus olseni]KAF4740968.1 hypothetical protein FOZ63_023674 [Perkinsus olseni]
MLSVITLSSLFLTLSLALDDGYYCGLYGEQIIGPITLYACMAVGYNTNGKEKVEFNYKFFDRVNIAVTSDVVFDGDKMILKRDGKAEGPDLFPYFDVKVNFKTSPDRSDMVIVEFKDGSTPSVNLTKQGCEVPPGVRASCGVPGGRRLERDRPREGVYTGEAYLSPGYKPNRTRTNYDRMSFFVDYAIPPPHAGVQLYDPRTLLWYVSDTTLIIGEVDNYGEQPLTIRGRYLEGSKSVIEVKGTFRYDSFADLIYYFPPDSDVPYITGHYVE